MKEHLPDKNVFLGKEIPGVPKYVIKEYIDSGCNALVFRATNPDLNKDLACKIIPRKNIQDDLYISGDWSEEAKKANILSNPLVVRCQFSSEWKDEDGTVDAVVLCYDFIEGKSLKKFIKENRDQVTIGFVSRLLESLLGLLFELDSRGMQHGDLHMGNVLVEEANKYQLRPQASFRVTDFGVATFSSEATVSDDHEQIAIIIRELLKRIDYQGLDAHDRFYYNALNDRFLGRYLVEKDVTREPSARNPRLLFTELSQLEEEFTQREKEIEESNLLTPFDYLSCEQIGDSHTVLKALYSDQFLGITSIESRNNVVITGPRGCGKTTVFRSLSLFHRILTDDALPKDINYIGIYYRCDDLYFTFPRYLRPLCTEAYSLPLHYITATLLIEVINTIGLWGEKYFNAELHEKESEVASKIWVELDVDVPNSPDKDTFRGLVRYLTKERKRVSDKQRFASDEKQSWGKYFREDTLLRVVSKISEISTQVKNKPFYFFVDDYSDPKITLDLQMNLNRLLMQRNAKCFFKLSTESPVSFSVNDIDGKTYVEGREFLLLNLGLEFLGEEKDRKLQFLEDVFNRRLSAVAEYPVSNLYELIGDCEAVSNNEVARRIRDKNRVLVWGRSTLADICSGDIHYIINLVGRMVSDAGGVSYLLNVSELPKIKPAEQNKVIRDEAGNFLNNLRGLFKHGEQLVEVVTAFGNVAHSYLMYKSSKNEQGRPPHQATRIEPFDELSLSGDAEIIYKELLRYSVFIEDRRGKSRRGKVVPRLWLRRFLIPHFNLTFSKRDSVSLEKYEIEQLLVEPKKFEDSHRLKKETLDIGQEQHGLFDQQGMHDEN